MDHNHIKGNFVNHFKSNAYSFQEVQARINQASSMKLKKPTRRQKQKWSSPGTIVIKLFKH